MHFSVTVYNSNILNMKKMGRPKTLEAVVQQHDGDIKITGSMLYCEICNIKIRRDTYSLNRHVDSNKHVMVKKLLGAPPAQVRL